MNLKQIAQQTKNCSIVYLLKKIRSPKNAPLQQIKSKEGEIITDDKEIMNRWREYLEELLEAEQGQYIDPSPNVNVNGTQTGQEITLEETTDAFKKMKIGKAPEHDNLKSELLKYMGESGTKYIT